ncbi:MAG: NADAR family protein [Bdellovibrionia bacterium]
MKTLLLFFALATLLIGCDKSAKTPEAPNQVEKLQRAPYPSHWWQPVDPKTAKKWEILPQAAGPNQVVLSKRNELGLLSNFAETPFVLDGVCYRTLESYWQMMKYPENSSDERFHWANPWKFTREEVMQMNGYEAKSAGNYANDLMQKNNYNFVTYRGEKLIFAEAKPGRHYQLIRNAFREKLLQNDSVLAVLYKTGTLELLPDHKINSKSPPEWHYNRLWMEIRNELLANRISFQSQESYQDIQNCQSLY